MRKLFNKVRGSILYVRAMGLSSKHKDEEALSLIRKADPLITYSSAKLAFGSLLYFGGCYAEALTKLDKAGRYIELDRSLNEAEKKYMKCYATSIFKSAAEKLGARGAYRYDTASRDVDLDMVAFHLKRNFPLPEHPNWERPAKKRSLFDV